MSPTGDLLVTQFFLGKCPLELAQGPSCVALAWHKARGSTPFGVTKNPSLCSLCSLAVAPPLLLPCCCSLAAPSPQNLCFEGPSRDPTPIHKNIPNLLPDPSGRDICDLRGPSCKPGLQQFKKPERFIDEPLPCIFFPSSSQFSLKLLGKCSGEVSSLTKFSFVSPLSPLPFLFPFSF